LGLDFVPPEDAAYFYDGYTRPDARRYGIDAAVRAFIFEALRKLGKTRVFSYVRNDNPAGLRAAGRCQKTVARVRSVRVFSLRPWAVGRDRSALASILREPKRMDHDEAADRAADWRRWFEGWLEQPVARRSIGFHELPQEAF